MTFQDEKEWFNDLSERRAILRKLIMKICGYTEKEFLNLPRQSVTNLSVKSTPLYINKSTEKSMMEHNRHSNLTSNSSHTEFSFNKVLTHEGENRKEHEYSTESTEMDKSVDAKQHSFFRDSTQKPNIHIHLDDEEEKHSFNHLERSFNEEEFKSHLGSDLGDEIRSHYRDDEMYSAYEGGSFMETQYQTCFGLLLLVINREHK